MNPSRLLRVIVLTLVLCLTGLSTLAAESTGAQATPPQSSPPQTPPTPPDQPAKPALKEPEPDLNRIKSALSKAPALKIEENQLRFYLEVRAKFPTIAEIIGDYDLINGPTKGGATMTHQEYLNMVTPKELYSTAGIKPAEMLQFALVNYFGQMAIRKLVEELRNARDEREIREIRARIDRELAALRGKSDR